MLTTQLSETNKAPEHLIKRLKEENEKNRQFQNIKKTKLVTTARKGKDIKITN